MYVPVLSASTLHPASSLRRAFSRAAVTMPGAKWCYCDDAGCTPAPVRGIVAVIAEQGTQAEHRKRRGSAGDRRVSYDRNAYRGRTVIERTFNGVEQWRGLASRDDKHAIVYRAGTSSPPASSGSPAWETRLVGPARTGAARAEPTTDTMAG